MTNKPATHTSIKGYKINSKATMRPQPHLSMKFIMLINVKMSIIVGILRFISKIKTTPIYLSTHLTSPHLILKESTPFTLSIGMCNTVLFRVISARLHVKGQHLYGCLTLLYGIWKLLKEK